MHKILWLESFEGRYYSEDLGINGWIILDWIMGKEGVEVSTGFIWLRIGTSGGPCKHGNEPSYSIQGWEIMTR
jgi:hypothetical protein